MFTHQYLSDKPHVGITDISIIRERQYCRSFLLLLCNAQPCPRSALGLPYEKFRNIKHNVAQQIAGVAGLP